MTRADSQVTPALTSGFPRLTKSYNVRHAYPLRPDMDSDLFLIRITPAVFSDRRLFL